MKFIKLWFPFKISTQLFSKRGIVLFWLARGLGDLLALVPPAEAKSARVDGHSRWKGDGAGAPARAGRNLGGETDARDRFRVEFPVKRKARAGGGMPQG